MGQEEKQPQVDTLAEIEKENKEMMKQLTNKNEEYFFQLDKRLVEEGYPTEDIERLLHEMLEETLELQEQSIPARRHYGTVTEYVRKLRTGEIDEANKQEEISPLWQRYVDGALLLGGLFALINGVGSLNLNVLKYEPAGLGELLINFLLGGLVMLLLTKNAPRPGEKWSFLKYFATSILAMLIWVIGISTLRYFAMEFPALNPQLPGYIIILIGSLALSGRYFFKRHYNIKGGLF